MDSSRLGRERSFHDERFTDDSDRAAAAKYYSVTRSSSALVNSVLASVPAGARVLELGCGLTNHAIGLGRRGVDVVAIDLSPVAVSEMQERIREESLTARVRVEVMNAEALMFEPATFDLVVGTGILHHLDLTLAFPELARVLAPAGVGVFVEPLGRNPVINLYRRATPRMRTPDEHPLLESDFELAGACFSQVGVDHFTALTLAAVPLRRTAWFEPVLGRLERADAWLFRRLPIARALAWTSVIQLRGPTLQPGFAGPVDL